MRKLAVFILACLILAMPAAALARQEPNSDGTYQGTNANGTPRGNIVANDYTFGTNTEAKNWNYYEQGAATSSGAYSGSTGFTTSTHVYGTWNSPYTLGIDGFNYNDAQDYVTTGDQTTTANGKIIFQSGPHGGYVTTTHRCRECHAVHRASGQFKLLRSDTRFESCDWCHGCGAGSGFNIQMDNDDNYTIEYNVGHTMGYGIDSGKWRAPDDTYPAFAPTYYMGGFSCFDCHSPHANPQRILGFSDDGTAVGLSDGTKIYGILNPGHAILVDDSTHIDTRPIYLSGSWLLIKNPDREMAAFNASVQSGIVGGASVAISAGAEIPDSVVAPLNEFDPGVAYPVNKMPIDWNEPVGAANTADPNIGLTQRNTTTNCWNISEFCTDCHDGNAGLHSTEAPVFCEDRALRNTATTATDNWKGNYELASGHDEQSRFCQRQLNFNPEDGQNFGPSCRNCHKGSTACGACHTDGNAVFSNLSAQDANNTLGVSSYNVRFTSTQFADGQNPITTNNQIAGFYSSSGGLFKNSRTGDWDTAWRTRTDTVAMGSIMKTGGTSGACLDNGFSWPHRTLGWKMLKDDLFGLNFDGTPVAVGANRTNGATTLGPAHDLDSVCLDCHNPYVWAGAPTGNHTDSAGSTADDAYDELLLRGLP